MRGIGGDTQGIDAHPRMIYIRRRRKHTLAAGEAIDFFPLRYGGYDRPCDHYPVDGHRAFARVEKAQSARLA